MAIRLSGSLQYLLLGLPLLVFCSGACSSQHKSLDASGVYESGDAGPQSDAGDAGPLDGGCPYSVPLDPWAGGVYEPTIQVDSLRLIGEGRGLSINRNGVGLFHVAVLDAGDVAGTNYLTFRLELDGGLTRYSSATDDNPVAILDDDSVVTVSSLASGQRWYRDGGKTDLPYAEIDSATASGWYIVHIPRVGNGIVFPDGGVVSSAVLMPAPKGSFDVVNGVGQAVGFFQLGLRGPSDARDSPGAHVGMHASRIFSISFAAQACDGGGNSSMSKP